MINDPKICLGMHGWCFEDHGIPIPKYPKNRGINDAKTTFKQSSATTPISSWRPSHWLRNATLWLPGKWRYMYFELPQIVSRVSSKKSDASSFDKNGPECFRPFWNWRSCNFCHLWAHPNQEYLSIGYPSLMFGIITNFWKVCMKTYEMNIISTPISDTNLVFWFLISISHYKS